MPITTVADDILTTFYAPASDDAGGAYSFSVSVSSYVGTCVRMYTLLYDDPVRLGLRHLHQVEFYSFIVRYPTAGASMYCEHISSFFVVFFFRVNTISCES